jgi:hypothetical protein
MRNIKGFINKKYTQPDYYRCLNGLWEAVYNISNIEYIVEVICDPYDIERKEIIEFDLLKQVKNGRINIKQTTFKSIKEVIKIIDNLKEKENQKLYDIQVFIIGEGWKENKLSYSNIKSYLLENQNIKQVSFKNNNTWSDFGRTEILNNTNAVKETLRAI